MSWVGRCSTVFAPDREVVILVHRRTLRGRRGRVSKWDSKVVSWWLAPQLTDSSKHIDITHTTMSEAGLGQAHGQGSLCDLPWSYSVTQQWLL
jgi:hypothetical protein